METKAKYIDSRDTETLRGKSYEDPSMKTSKDLRETVRMLKVQPNMVIIEKPEVRLEMRSEVEAVTQTISKTDQ